MELLERLRDHLTRTRLVPRGARVVVAVSGGVDSMALLHAMHVLAPDFGWKLSVAHFNHRLRGRSSDADERLVRVDAQRLKLPCDIGAANIRKVAAEQGVSIEMAAREMRHAFLARSARARGAKLVAFAHHADDQAELFFLRLLRGAGGQGLGGMKARSASIADRRITLVRPLLEVSKDEIAEFVQKSKLRFREDASNASPDFERNWIRIKLLPLLRQRQPAIVQTILRTMQIVEAEADLVALIAKQTTGGASYQSLHLAVQRRLIQRQLHALGVPVDFQLVETLRKQAGQKVSVGAGMELVCDIEGRVRRTQRDKVGFGGGEVRVELSGAASSRQQLRGVVDFGGLRLSWRVFRRAKGFEPSRTNGREFFDADKVGAWMLLRHWRAGDRFQPIGMPAATKLQDWFTNRKVPAARRRRLVLAESERGGLFWVQGERIGELAKLTPQTRTVLELKWKQL